eukprot:3302504-Rhodomonas_salina.2
MLGWELAVKDSSKFVGFIARIQSSNSSRHNRLKEVSCIGARRFSERHWNRSPSAPLRRSRRSLSPARSTTRVSE